MQQRAERHRAEAEARSSCGSRIIQLGSTRTSPYGSALPYHTVPLLVAQALAMGLPMPKQYLPGALPPFEPHTRLSTPAVPLLGSSSALPTPSLQAGKKPCGHVIL